MTFLSTKVQSWYPSATDGASVSPSGSNWGNSGWQEVVSSTAGAIQIFQLSVAPGIVSEFEIDVGKGTAGAETVVATIRGSATTLGSGENTIIHRIGVDNIPASTRVAVRLRKAGTDATAWLVGVGYVPATDS